MINSDKHNPETDVKPWYRQFWAWFILSPLIVVVIVSSFTVTVAVRYADDRVVDNYYKEGRLINMRQDEDVYAKELAVTAAVAFDRELSELVIKLDKSGEVLPESLRLGMSHPAKADYDHTIVLKRIADNHYHAELNQPLVNRWYLRLQPIYQDTSIASWRLRGEINFSQTESIVLKFDE